MGELTSRHIQLSGLGLFARSYRSERCAAQTCCWLIRCNDCVSPEGELNYDAKIRAVKYSGSCLCSEVRFEVDGDFDGFFLCHCKHCQKGTGSAHAANLFSCSAKLRWLSGEDKVSSFRLPGTRHARSFCSRCGSALPNIQLDSKQLVVPAGSIDGEISMEPEGHIFMSSRANWDHDLERIREFEKLPN